MSAGGAAWSRGSGGRRSSASGERSAVPGAGRRSASSSPKCVATATTTTTRKSPTPNHTTAPALTSVSWCARSPSRGGGAVRDDVGTDRSSMVGLHRELHPRIVDGEQRAPVELPQEERGPDPADADRSGEVEDVERDSPGMEDRLDEPDHVDHPHREDPPGDPRQETDVLLDPAREEQQERRSEVREQDEERHELPRGVEARQVPGDLLREVSRPDDDELREGHVSPEHQEHELEVPEVAEDEPRRRARERFGGSEVANREQDDGHRRE